MIPYQRYLAVMLLVSTATVTACKLKNAADNSSLAASAGDVAYTGHSNYRLLLVGHAGPEFNPNQDLLKPAPAEASREAAATALRAAALKSLIPIMSEINGQKTGTEQDLMASLMALTDSARKTLQEDLKPILASSSAQFPLASEAWLVPWTETSTDVFYNANKISISPTEAANVLTALPGSEGFNKVISEKIQKLRTKLRAQPNTPVFLLASRYFMFIAPGKSRLSINLLIGLAPFSGPFEKDDPKVKFKTVVVPDIPGKGLTAAVTFSVPLEQSEAPIVKVAFGDFKAYEKGVFAMETSGAAKAVPRLEGTANKTGTRWIALNFGFKDLALNLQTAQIDQISTLVSPGLKIGKANWTVGGIHAESIDQTFQDEINKTIDTELQGAIDKGNDQVLDGLLSKEVLELAFKKIFHRA